MTSMTTAPRMKYLGVELLRKDATKSSVPDVGLFRGLRERSHEDKEKNKRVISLILIGTKDKPNDLKALNLAVFNVLSMQMMYEDTKELIIFKCSVEDQDKAKEMLSVALEEFQKEDRMVDNDPEIIDISTFDDVPEEFFAPKKETKTTGTGAATGAYGYGGNYNTGNSDWQEKQKEREEQKKKEDKMRWTPTLFKRKGGLPALKILNLIKKKVRAVAAGEYECVLPDPDPNDTMDADGKKFKVEDETEKK
jgi:hypothetical protein